MSRLSNRWNFSTLDPQGNLDDFVRAILSLVNGNLDGKNLKEYSKIKNPIIEADLAISEGKKFYLDGLQKDSYFIVVGNSLQLWLAGVKKAAWGKS